MLYGSASRCSLGLRVGWKHFHQDLVLLDRLTRADVDGADAASDRGGK